MTGTFQLVSWIDLHSFYFSYVEHVMNICHLELANHLTKRTLLVIR